MMTKQRQQKEQQQQNAGQKGKDPNQQGGRSAQGQPGTTAGSQGQPGARRSDQGSGSQSPGNKGGSQGSRRSSNQFGSSADDDDQSPAMNRADEEGDDSSEDLRRGALDAQYGTDTSSKLGQQSSRPQGRSSSSRSKDPSEASTGSDRDTMTGPRNKSR
jgi:hypothetical protein